MKQRLLLTIKLSLVLFIVIISRVNAQSLINESFKYLGNDSVKLNVWLPYQYSEQESYPVLYLNNYGAFSEFGLNVAAAMHSNNRSRNYPKVIVVEIIPFDNQSTTALLGYSYSQNTIDQNGKAFIDVLRNTIFPYINRKYSHSTFSTYLGHSYCASYGIQLLYDYPDLFDSYMLFAPETLSENYTVRRPNIDSLNGKFIYMATGNKDVARRVELNKSYTKVFSGYKELKFRGDLIEGGGHNDIVDLSLNEGLADLFKNYFSINRLDSADLVNSFKIEKERVKSVFKLETLDLRNHYYSLYNLAERYKNRTFLEFLLNNEAKLRNSPIHLFNIGYILSSSFDDRKSAEKCYTESIATAKKMGKPKEALNGYLWLSKFYSEENPDKAMNLLLEGYNVCKSDLLVYSAATLALKHKRLKSRGIEILDELLSRPNTLINYGITNDKLLELKNKNI